jgi:hypothetical protein
VSDDPLDDRIRDADPAAADIRYFVTVGSATEMEVTLEQFVLVERKAGIANPFGYPTRRATAGFSRATAGFSGHDVATGAPMKGRVQYHRPIPPAPAPQRPAPARRRWWRLRGGRELRR